MHSFSKQICNWCCFFLWFILFTGHPYAQTVSGPIDLPPDVADPKNLTALPAQQQNPKRFSKFELDMALNVGIRYDQLLWNTAGASHHPNILSELEWSNVLSHQISLNARSLIVQRIYIHSYFDYAWIDSGEMRDSDYSSNDRAGEWSRSISQTEGDQVWDGSMGCGYAFQFKDKKWLIAPLIGVSVHKQNFRITDGRQVISKTPPANFNDPPNVGSLSSDLNSMYRTQWTSHWIGYDLRYQVIPDPGQKPTMVFRFSMFYHLWADYHGQAEWNLRNDLAHPISFEHDADATGLSVQFEWSIGLSRNLHFNFNVDYKNWTTETGKVTTYVIDETDGSVDKQHGRLNEVKWQGYSAGIGLNYSF